MIPFQFVPSVCNHSLFLCFGILSIIPFKLVRSVCDSIDMALDALKEIPTLVTALDKEKESPVLALASMSFAYPSGNHLIFWKQWIYSCESHALFSTGH